MVERTDGVTNEVRRYWVSGESERLMNDQGCLRWCNNRWGACIQNDDTSVQRRMVTKQGRRRLWQMSPSGLQNAGEYLHNQPFAGHYCS
jgi:hypothetical protein